MDSEESSPTHAHGGRDLTTGSIPRQLVTFALPLLAGSAIQCAYTLVNRIWVGQFLGPEALAAITVTMQVTFVLVALANGLTMGSSILVSQFVGARNWEAVRRVVQSSVLLILILGGVLLVAGEIAAPALLRAINTPPEAWRLALPYMRIFIGAFPLVFTGFLTIALLRGTGDSLTPLYFQAAGVVINAILDPLLMLGWLGFPRLGLNGTAVGMLVGQTVTIVAFFVYLHRKKHLLSPDWRGLRPDWQMAKLTAKIGLPAGAQQLLVSLGGAVVITFVNRFGENATAGFGAAGQVDMVPFFVAMSFGMAVSVLAGQNIGAGRFARVRHTFWAGLALSGSLVTVFSLLAVTYPTGIMRLFVNPAHDPAPFAIGVEYLRIVGASYLFFAVMFAGVGVINGAGHTFVGTITTLVGLWLVRIPLAAYLSHRMDSVTGIWYAMVISFSVSMLLSVGYVLSGLWKRPIVKHGLAPAAEVAQAPQQSGVIEPL